MESFENKRLLCDSLVDWLRWGEGLHNTTAYDMACQMVGQHYQIEPQKIKGFLLQSFRQGQWKVRQETLNQETIFNGRFSCVLFDPYSSQTSPDCGRKKPWSVSSLRFLNLAVFLEPMQLQVISHGLWKRRALR